MNESAPPLVRATGQAIRTERITMSNDTESPTLTLADFLLARIAEDEDRATMARGWQTGSRHEGQPLDWSIHMDRWSPDRVLAECEAKRRMVELHKSWPVRVETPTTFETKGDGGSIIMRASRQMAWLTEQEYRERFGDEPPTTPMLRALASVYADHPDFSEEWA